jgi:hypothetical protein
MGAIWLLQWRLAYIVVGEPSELRSPKNANRQKHACLGFLADIRWCHSGNVWYQLGAVEL